jgi:hypothetical protein
MNRAQFALCQGDLRNGLFETFLVHGPISELVVKLRFLLQKPIYR